MHEINPDRLAQKGISELEQMADPHRALQAQRYFKEPVLFYGISSAPLRLLADSLYREVKGKWTLGDAFRLCEQLFQSPYHEARALGILILSRYKRNLPADFPQRLGDWLQKDYLNSWALVDITCPDLMGAYLETFPEAVSVLDSWSESDNRWKRRASIVSLLKPARKKEFHPAIYRLSAGHFSDRDDLIQKANGWLLREAGKADRKRLELFLRKHGAGIPRTTLRYAIERFEEEDRRRLLVETRRS